MKKKEIKEKLNMAFKEETPNLSESIIKACESEEQFAPEIELKPSVKRFNFRRFASVFACLALFVIGLVAGYFIPQGEKISQVETSLFIDVNPSIEVQLDENNTVLQINALNTDAEEVLKNLKLKGVEMDTAINAIIGSLYVNGYLTAENNSVLVSVDTKNKDNTEVLVNGVSNKISQVLKSANVNLSVIAQDVENSDYLKERADEHGISIGKMHLIDKMMDMELVDGGFDEEDIPDLAKMPIKDLNFLYSVNPIHKNKGEKPPQEVIVGEVGGYIEKESALQAVLKTISLDESEVEWYELRVHPQGDNNQRKMVYSITLKKKNSNELLRYEVDPKTGLVTASGMVGTPPPPPPSGD